LDNLFFILQHKGCFDLIADTQKGHQMFVIVFCFRCFGLLLAQGRDVSEEEFHLLQNVS